MGPLPDDAGQSQRLVTREDREAWHWSASWTKQEPSWSLLGDRELWARAWSELAERHRYISRARLERSVGPDGLGVITANWFSARRPLAAEHSELPARFGVWTKSLDDRESPPTSRPNVADPW